MSVMLIGLQCQLDSPSPSVSLLRQMVQFLQCILAPVFYAIHPFSVWSSSFVLSFHYSEHHYLQFPVITHSGNMSKPIFTPYCFLQDCLFSVDSTEYCVVCYFLCQFHSHDSSVTLAFERQ